jgi:CheY-like chemotaxis protein
MKKVLVLDDDKSRMAKFFLNKQDTDLRQVWNAADCIEALKDGHYDICQLDHDLEGVYQDPAEENTGSGVVRWVVENRPQVDKFIVHSYNERAALGMVEALLAAGYWAVWIPFNL